MGHTMAKIGTKGGIFHDPELFQDPDSFIPERFLKSEYGTIPGVDDSDLRHTLPFGFGRVRAHGVNAASLTN